MTATLAIEGLRKSFGRTPVLHGIDLAMTPGEMLVIVGASGCGKSTLLRLVAGLETPDAGRILIAGRDVTRLDPAARDIAMVFQNYALYPHMSAFDNMAYGLRIRGLSRAEIAAKVAETAALLGISALLDRKPRQLSGGQRQRVAMGRAIVREPKLFLFDEPLSNLDATLRLNTRVEIKRLQRRLGVTSLFVTHDQVEAMTLGDRLLVMHEGRAVQIATPMEVFHRPANLYVAGFIGASPMNFLPATLSHDGTAATLSDGLVLPFADGRRLGSAGRALTIGIRPEHVEAASEGQMLSVELVEPLGSECVVIGRMADGQLLSVRLAGAAPEGDRITLRFPSKHLHVFDTQTGLRIDPQ